MNPCLLLLRGLSSMRSNLPPVKTKKKLPYHKNKTFHLPPVSFFKIILSAIIILIAGINIFFLFVSTDPYIQAKKLTFSLSKGDQYFGRLSLWYLYAKDEQWLKAQELESKLNPVDIALYKSQNYPTEVKKRLNSLSVKQNKTTEDWMEISILQTKLNKKQEAKNSLTKAFESDPIRTDIEKLYYELSK